MFIGKRRCQAAFCKKAESKYFLSSPPAWDPQWDCLKQQQTPNKQQKRAPPGSQAVPKEFRYVVWCPLSTLVILKHIWHLEMLPKKPVGTWGPSATVSAISQFWKFNRFHRAEQSSESTLSALHITSQTEWTVCQQQGRKAYTHSIQM